MKAIVTDAATAARVLSGEQTIITTADQPDVAAGERVAFVVDDAVVCTVTVDDALPIVPDDDVDYLEGSLILSDDRGQMWRVSDDDAWFSPMHDQLPLGDFTPGRWGWLLSDPQPCDRWWHCHGEAVGEYEYGICSPDEAIHFSPCGWRPAKPIPCKGRQGVFTLPDDVAAQIGGES